MTITEIPRLMWSFCLRALRILYAHRVGPEFGEFNNLPAFHFHIVKRVLIPLIIVLCSGVVFPSSRLDAASLYHSILESDSFESYQSQRACFGLFSARTRISCLPTDYLIKDGKIGISLILKAEEESYKIYHRFAERELDSKFLDQLFRNDNFQFASGLSRIQAIYGMTSVSFTPINFSGAFKLNNPSLPHVVVGGFTQRVFRISQNFYWKRVLAGADLLASPSFYLAERTFFNAEFDALDTATKRPRSLVSKRSDRHQDFDGAIGWYWRYPWVPSVYLKVENTQSSDICNPCKARKLDVEHEFSRKSRVTASSYVDHFVGRSVFSLTAPFDGVYQSVDRLRSSASYILQLSTLNSFFSFSPLMYSFGFLFAAESYRVGLQYSDEKQDNSILIDRQKRTHVFASYSL